jgi:hypothetical protein
VEDDRTIRGELMRGKGVGDGGEGGGVVVVVGS